MANELTALPQFTRVLFKHAFMFLPWFCRNHSKFALTITDYLEVTRYLDALKKDKPQFFGNLSDLSEARNKLDKFYTYLRPRADKSSDHERALHKFSRAWHYAWLKRKSFELRGHEVRLMKFFHEIYTKHRSEHIPELQAMARLIDPETVTLARMIQPAGHWTPSIFLESASDDLKKYELKLFKGSPPDPELCQKARKSKPKTYARFQKALRNRKEAARLRMIEIFDHQKWFPFIDSATLYDHLKEEKLDDFLPSQYRGRIGVQPTGYPLTFYTYAGLELESPPLNEVVMNMNYGKEEKDKDYKLHPVSDGTFYCETKAMVGESKTKHYTLEYKRRARRIKYEKVNLLKNEIDSIRARLLDHVRCDHRDTWVRALMCLIIDSECARIGNQASTKGKVKTYGITTLLTRKHVKVKDDKIIISYKGKHAQNQKHTLPVYRTLEGIKKYPRQAIVAERLLCLINENRKYLFTRDDKKPYTPQMVNEYFTADKPDPENHLPFGGANSPCTVHNIRNYHATRMFREFADKMCRRKKIPTYDEVLTAYQGRNQTKNHKGKKGILQIVADKLGNTPAICRKSYIDPKEQLLFFQRWGYRPPDCIIRDLFVHEEHDTYGLREILRYERKRAKLAVSKVTG